MNALGYVRISIKDQSNYSLENQERNVREYCTKNSLNLLRIFKDDGESSYSFDRPDWHRLEAFIKENKSVKYLVIFDHDRFSRNLAEALLKIKELQDKFSIKVMATTDSFDTDFTDPSTFMIRAFKYMMAESELHRIRQRTKSGMLQGALNGRFLNKAPFAYINSKDAHGQAVILKDEEKAYVINLIFKEYNRGMNIEDLRKVALQHGFRQKGNSAIQRVLSNPVYAGLIKVPAYKGSAEKFIKGIHEPVVSEFDYWRAQDRLKNKSFTIQRKDDVPLRGVLKCKCGRLMTAGNSRGKTGKYYWYYLCPVHRENFSGTKIHDQFNELLDLLSYSEERIAWFTEKLSSEISIQLNQKGELLARAQKALRTVNEKISATEEKYLEDPSMNKTTYVRVMNNHRSQRSELEKRLHDLNTNQNIYWQKLNALLPKMHDIRGTFEELDLYRKQQFINLVFDSSLSYENNIYRTLFIHPMFAHNALELKEKGLLEIRPEPLELATAPNRTPIGNSIEMLSSLYDLLAA